MDYGSRIPLWLAACLVLGAAVPAAPVRGDGNLIGNPELDVEATTWHGGAWSPDDSRLLPRLGKPGAPVVELCPVFGCNDLGFWRATALTCVQVTPGTTVHQSADVRSNQATFLYLLFFSDTGCSTAAGDNADPGIFVPAGEWQTARRTSVIPAGVLSVFPQFTSGGFASTEVAGNVDRAWLGFADRIFTDDFELESPCRWSTSPV